MSPQLQQKLELSQKLPSSLLLDKLINFINIDNLIQEQCWFQGWLQKMILGMFVSDVCFIVCDGKEYIIISSKQQMETLNNSPLLILRHNNKQFKSKQRLLNKRVKNKTQLREEIYSNHNIFQSSINLYRNMTAQNLIWDKNYNFKCVINQVKEQNSSLKARIWNVQKQNRKMERQIQSWSLNDYLGTNLTKKPYIDMATVEKVVCDQDYNIVSLKMQIFQLQKILQDRNKQYESVVQRNKQAFKLSSVFNHQIVEKKIEICQFIEAQTQNPHNIEKAYQEKMSVNILRQNQALDLIAKNIQIKKKSRNNIENDLASITHECELQKNITYQEIERLNQQTRKMKAEQDGGINLQRQKVKLAEKNRLDYQCFMQGQMGSFIKQKMPLKHQIQMLKQALEHFQLQQKLSNNKQKSISID